MRRMWMVVVLIGFMAGLAGSARADEIAELRKLMEQQYEQMRQMQNRLIALEKAQGEQGQAIEEIEKTGMAMPQTLSWIENISFYGDFRFRFEHYDVETDTSGDSSRDRARVRARVGLKARINEEFSVDVRVASGSENPTSTNQDLGDGFTSKDLWLDRAVLQYQPTALDGWTFLFGKMGNPFYRPGGSQLILDGDVTPEGIAAQYKTNLNDGTKLFVNGGGFWVIERYSSSDDNSDTSLFGVQAGLQHLFTDSSLTWGGSYYDYHNIKGKEWIYGSKSNGNTDGGSGTYLYDYQIVQLFGQYDMKLGDVPFSLYGDYARNIASDVDSDTGWLIGATYNKAKAAGSWQVGYEYREQQKDCVVGALTDADPFNGGTNGKGHKVSAKYALADNTQLGATYWISDRDGDSDGQHDDNYEKIQVDVVVKF